MVASLDAGQQRVCGGDLTPVPMPLRGSGLISNVVFQPPPLVVTLATRRRTRLAIGQLPSVRVLEVDTELGRRVPVSEIRAGARGAHRPRPLARPGCCGRPRRGDGRPPPRLPDARGPARPRRGAGRHHLHRAARARRRDPSLVAAVRDETLVRYHVLWHVLTPARFAVLDEDFSRALGQWPQVMRVLLERALGRTLRVSIHAALLQLSPVETRLLDPVLAPRRALGPGDARRHGAAPAPLASDAGSARGLPARVGHHRPAPDRGRAA